jgi:hypothetical protein
MNTRKLFANNSDASASSLIYVVGICGSFRSIKMHYDNFPQTSQGFQSCVPTRTHTALTFLYLKRNARGKVIIYRLCTYVLEYKKCFDWGSMNCLDPGPCSSKRKMHVWQEGGGLPLGTFVTPDSCFGGNRKSEGIEATCLEDCLSTFWAHCWRVWAINRVSMMHFNIIVLLLPLSKNTCMCASVLLFFFSGK